MINNPVFYVSCSYKKLKISYKGGIDPPFRDYCFTLQRGVNF